LIVANLILNRLTDEQWRDAFRPGGYNPDQTIRYVTKIKGKIAQGLGLTADYAASHEDSRRRRRTRGCRRARQRAA
jgi:hypothetical protein